MKATYTALPTPPPPKRLTIEFEDEDILMVRLLGWATATFPDALRRDALALHATAFNKFQHRLRDACNAAGVPGW